MADMINFRVRMFSKILRALTQVITCVLALLLLTAVMVIVQAQRDETRPADAALVLNNSATLPVQPQLDTALVLHRRGIVSRILLAGDESSAAGRYLTQQGTPANAVLISEPGLTLRQQIDNAATAARTGGANSVVIVAERWELLRALKIARDDGLVAYGAPAQIAANRRSLFDTASMIMRESWAYLGYLFVGR